MATTPNPVTNPIALTVAQRLGSPIDQFNQAAAHAEFQLRVAMPGIIESFDATKLVATVSIAVQEWCIVQGVPQWTSIKLLVDVPVQFPRAGGFSITFPV
jgi:hypothetical protein